MGTEKDLTFAIVVPFHVKDMQHCEALTAQLQRFETIIDNLEIIFVLNAFDSTNIITFKKVVAAATLHITTKILTFKEALIIGLARNIGALHTNADYTIFMDCDVELRTNSIYSLVETCKKISLSGAVAIFPNVELYKGVSIWTEIDSYEDIRSYRARVKGTNAKILYGPFNVIKTSFFKSLGGWEYRIVCSEDRDLALRILQSGKSIYYDENLVVLHKNSSSIRRIFKRKVFHARVNALTYLRYPYYYSKTPMDWIAMITHKLNPRYHIVGAVYSLAIIVYIIVFYYSMWKLKTQKAHLIRPIPFHLF